MTAPRRYWAGDGSAFTLRVLLDEVLRRDLPPHRLLAETGFNARDADNPFGRISRDALFRFAEGAATLTGDSAFHLDATAHAQIGAFGAADFVVTTAPTLGIGLSRVAAGYAVINSGLRIEPVVGTREARLRLSAIHEPFPHPVDVETLAIATASRSRSATHGKAGPIRVTRTGPDRGYRARFESLLACPVDYDADEDTIVFDRATWDTRPATTHPAFATLFALVAEPVVAALVPTPPLAASVACVIEERLADGGLNAAQVAAVLDVAPRTLHRRLASEGRRFGELVDAVRLRVAQRELARGRSVGEVAELVGFSEAAAFSRAYRRWTGHPPGAHRAGPPNAGE